MIAVFRIGYAKARTLREHAYGSEIQVGRWHSLKPGRRLVYCASSRALAQLEKRVNCHRKAPIEQALFRVDVPNGDAITSALDHGLPARWRDDEAVSRTFGDDWLDAGSGPAMWVPSYVEPLECNLLINPDHEGVSTVGIQLEREPILFDPRLY